MRLFYFIKSFLFKLFHRAEKNIDANSGSYPNWYAIALKELNIKEVSGTKHNPRIIEYHKQTSLKAKDDETAWCSSFANWCVIKSGVRGTNSAAARSWLKWGHGIAEPRKGCVVVFWRGSLKGWQGHVAFFVKEDKNYIYVLGGNQNNSVNVTAYTKDRLLGYRWP